MVDIEPAPSVCPPAALQVRQPAPRLRADVDEIRAAVYEPIGPRVDPIMIALREARETAGLSRADVARRLGIHEGTVRDHEAGRRVPDLGQVRRYADAYGVDLAVVGRRR